MTSSSSSVYNIDGKEKNKLMYAISALLSRALLQRRPRYAPMSSPDESTSEPRPTSPTTSILARFPVEILLHVVSFLPPESAVSLSLLSKYSYATLNSHIDITLGRGPQDKKHLLHLLEIDWPDLMACHGCNILYPWKRSPDQYICRER